MDFLCALPFLREVIGSLCSVLCVTLTIGMYLLFTLVINPKSHGPKPHAYRSQENRMLIDSLMDMVICSLQNK